MVVWFGFFVTLGCLVRAAFASAGDADINYRRCIEQCQQNGCVGGTCFKNCRFLSDDLVVDDPWYQQEPLYMQWKQWDCRSDCKYHCMQEIENGRRKNGHRPLKYHGKWPFKLVFGIQEPVSVALCVLNLAIHFHGWLLYFVLLYYKLPLRPENGKIYYENSYIWHIYGLLAMNSSFWSAFSHSRDFDFVKKLDYLSVMALFSYALILAMRASFSRRTAAVRVVTAAPLIAVLTSHVVYLNLSKFDYGVIVKVCAVIIVAILVMWAIMAGTTSHPSSIKLWSMVTGIVLAILLEIFDFPPYKGYVDAHALSHALSVPFTYVWWSFLRDDAVHDTLILLEKEP